MKINKAAVALASVLIGVSPVWGFTFDDINYWIGEGTNQCAVVVDFNDASVANSSFAWGYRWNGDAPSFKMILEEIAADDPRFTSFIAPDGWVNGLAYDADDDGGTFKTGTTYTKSDEDDFFPQAWYEFEEDDNDDEVFYVCGEDWASSYASGTTFDDLVWEKFAVGAGEAAPENGQWLLQRFSPYKMAMAGWSYLVDEYAPTNSPVAATRTYRLSDNELWVGHGTNETGVVISWGVGKTLTWGYRWNGEAPTVKQVLAEISAVDTRLVPHYSRMGTYSFLDTFGYDAGDVGGVTYDWTNYTASVASAWIAPYFTEYIDPEDWNTWIYHYFGLFTEPDAFYRTGASAYGYASVGVDEQPLQPGGWVILAYNEDAYLVNLDAASPAQARNGSGKIAKSKTKKGQTATWKATASAGSVFSHWEGGIVETMNLSANARRNPTLKFKMPAKLDAPRAVFVPISYDGLSTLWLEGDLPLAAGSIVTNLYLRDDSLSYVTATVTGLPAGMTFNSANLKFGGTPAEEGTYILTVTAKNASGYQLKKELRLVVGTDDPSVETSEVANTPCYSLLVNVAAGGGGTASGSGVFASNTVVAVKATPAKNRVFVGWFTDAACTLPAPMTTDYRAPAGKIRVPDARNLFAKFVKKGAATDPVANVACASVDETGTLTMMVGVKLAGTDTVTCESASLPSYKGSGLPAGVSVNKTTGAFTGAPTKVGTFKAKVTASNASTKKTLSITVKVLPLPAWAKGSFTGLAEETDITPGLATLTVGATGKISGKVSLLGTNWTFSAASFDAGGFTGGQTNLTITGTAKYVDAKKRTSDRAFAFKVNAPSNGVWNLSSVTGTFGDADYAVHRTIWNDSVAAVRELEANWVGSYKYLSAEGDVLRLRIQNTGAVLWTGYFANGRTFAGATPLLHEDADLIRMPFAITFAPAASVKAGKKAPAVNYPEFCDTVMFQYEMPEPGSPAERSN